MTAQSIRLDILTAPVLERGPTALRIILGGRLRKLREARGITTSAAGESIRGSYAKICRLELGRSGYKERDITDLLTLYGVTDPDQRREFVTLVRLANEHGWWHGYSDLLPGWFENYLGLEGAAESIATYEGYLVPGLLQTDDYTRAVMAPAHDEQEVDRRVELRHRRREILDRPDGPALWAILDESVLHRPVGGPEVLYGQLEHLVRMSQHPKVTLQILPYTLGGHIAVGTSFTILQFAEQELPDLVYLEQLASAVYLDHAQDLKTYHRVVNRLRSDAESPARSHTLLAAATAALQQHPCR